MPRHEGILGCLANRAEESLRGTAQASWRARRADAKLPIFHSEPEAHIKQVALVEFCPPPTPRRCAQRIPRSLHQPNKTVSAREDKHFFGSL